MALIMLEKIKGNNISVLKKIIWNFEYGNRKLDGNDFAFFIIFYFFNNVKSCNNILEMR